MGGSRSRASPARRSGPRGPRSTFCALFAHKVERAELRPARALRSDGARSGVNRTAAPAPVPARQCRTRHARDGPPRRDEPTFRLSRRLDHVPTNGLSFASRRSRPEDSIRRTTWLLARRSTRANPAADRHLQALGRFSTPAARGGALPSQFAVLLQQLPGTVRRFLAGRGWRLDTGYTPTAPYPTGKRARRCRPSLHPDRVGTLCLC